MNERSLPKEQQPDGVLDGEAAMQAFEDAKAISDEFSMLDSRTVDDSVIECELVSFQTTKSGNAIQITVEMPTGGEERNFRMKKPKTWSNVYEFVRWVRAYGYDSGTFHMMIRDDVKVEVVRENNSYELVIPESRTTRARNYIRSGWEELKGLAPRELFGLAFWFVGLAGFFAVEMQPSWDTTTPESARFTITVLGEIVAVTAIFVIAIIIASDE